MQMRRMLIELLRENGIYRNPNTLKHDDIGKFWVVVYPTPESEAEDIVWTVDMIGFLNIVRGAVYNPGEFYGFYKNETAARKKAAELLNNR